MSKYIIRVYGHGWTWTVEEHASSKEEALVNARSKISKNEVIFDDCIEEVHEQL